MSDYTISVSQGPFPGRTDVWAETPHYFSQLHSGIIGAILSQIWEPLLDQGYVVSKEVSIQIADMRKPDITIEQVRSPSQNILRYDYPTAAAEILAEPILLIETEEPDLQAIHIHELGTNRLVTVVEVISPRNKAYDPDMVRYQQQRSQLFLNQGTGVVEIDLTRSVKRLVNHVLTWQADYHVAVHLPVNQTYITPMVIGETLKNCALPLTNGVIGVDLQKAYTTAYREATVAAQIENNGHYIIEQLPFPSLLTEEQKVAALKAVENWRAELTRLRTKG